MGVGSQGSTVTHCPTPNPVPLRLLRKLFRLKGKALLCVNVYGVDIV